MRIEIESKEGDVIRVEKIILTDEEKAGLTVGRNDAFDVTETHPITWKKEFFAQFCIFLICCAIVAGVSALIWFVTL